jgi:hypothetical protein
VSVAITDAEPAADIDAGDGVPGSGQLAAKFSDARECLAQRFYAHDLRTDMHVQAIHAHMWKMIAGGEPAPRLGQAHAELVLGLAGRDLLVRAGIDVGIHAHGGMRYHVVLSRQALQAFEFVA